MNVQAKADSDIALANANSRFVVDERLRFESEAFANRQETLEEAIAATHYKSQAERQWDHSRSEIAQQALALDNAKRDLAYHEGLVAAATLNDPTNADQLIQKALKDANDKATHHQQEHHQAVNAVTSIQQQARQHLLEVDAMSNEANAKVAHAQSEVRRMERAQAESEAHHQQQIANLQQKLHPAKHGPATQTVPDFVSPDIPAPIPWDVL